MTAIRIAHVNIVDVHTGNVLPDRYIEARDGRISAIGASTVPAAPGVRVVDGSGTWAVPGLIDAHCHVSNSAAPDVVRSVVFDLPSFYAIRSVAHARNLLRAGVTTIRDVGAMYYIDIALRDAVESGLIEGPRVRASGSGIRMTGGHGDVRFSPSFHHTLYEVADGPDEVTRAARRNLKYGADMLKILSGSGGVGSGTSLESAQYSEDEIAAAVRVARDAGTKVAVHSHSIRATKRAVRAGAASIEHATFLDREAADMMAEAGTFVVPTFMALHRILENSDGAGIPAHMVSRARDAEKAHLESFQLALEAGVRVAMGTDAGTPFNHHGDNLNEIALMADAGMPPLAALRAATIDAAELLSWQDDLGSLDTGKLADVVLFDVDPLTDLGAYRDPERVRLVMKGGHVYRDELAGATATN